MFKKIAVGVDFTPLSERATAVALKLGRAVNALVVLVHVRPVGTDVHTTTEPHAPHHVALEQRLASLAEGYAKDTGLVVEHGVVDGHEAQELARFASLWGCDLVVLGSAGHTGVRQLMVGSVAAAVVQTATVPVLLVGPHATT